MHRGSMVEIIVPYGDPRHPFQHKCAFDVMDYGLGFTANSLELGCDCLGHIKYFDGMVNNAKGKTLNTRSRCYVWLSIMQLASGNLILPAFVSA